MPKEIRIGFDGPEEVDIPVVDNAYMKCLLNAQPKPKTIHLYTEQASLVDGNVMKVRTEQVAPVITEGERVGRDADRFLRQIRKGNK